MYRKQQKIQRAKQKKIFTIAPKLLLLFFLLFLFHNASAHELDLDILNLYLSENPRTLGFGGLDLNLEKDEVDLYHPARLVSEDVSYLSSLLKHENVYNSSENQAEDIIIKSNEFRMGGLVNSTHDGIIKKFTLGFQVGTDQASGHYRVAEDNSNVEYDKTIQAKLFAVGFQVDNFLSFGGGLEENNKNTYSFWEAEFRAHHALSFGVRRFQREFSLDIAAEVDSTQGLVPVEYSENVIEVMTKIKIHDLLTARFTVDIEHTDRKNIWLSSNVTEKLSLAYVHQSGAINYHQDIFADGTDSGHNNGEAEYSLWGAGLEFRPTDGTIYRANIRKSHFSTNGAGLVEADAASSFWDNLLEGERFFNYEFRGDSTQYHIGAEKRWTDRLTLRGGLQYIEIKPDGFFEHWTPFPLLGIGKLDDERMEFAYSKIDLGVLSAGLSYRVKNFEITYGLGQYILLALERERGTDGDGGGGDGEKWYDIKWDDIKEAWGDIKEKSGGTLQILEIKFFF